LFIGYKCWLLYPATNFRAVSVITRRLNTASLFRT